MITFRELDDLLGRPKEELQAKVRNNPIVQIRCKGRTFQTASNADAYYKLLALALREPGLTPELLARSTVNHAPASARLLYLSLDDIAAASSRQRAKAVTGGYAHTNENAEVTLAKICVLAGMCDLFSEFTFAHPLDGSAPASSPVSGRSAAPTKPAARPRSPAGASSPAAPARPASAKGPSAVPQRRSGALILGRGLSCWKKKDMQTAFVQEAGVYELVREPGGYTLYRGETPTLRAPAITPVSFIGQDDLPLGDAGVVLASNSQGMMGVFDLEGRMLIPYLCRSIQPETRKFSPRGAGFRLKAVDFNGKKLELKCSWFFPEEGGPPFSGVRPASMWDYMGTGISLSGYLERQGYSNSSFFWTGPACLRDGRLIGFHYGHTERFRGCEDFYYNLYLMQNGQETFLRAGSRGGIESLIMIETEKQVYLIWKDFNEYLCYSVEAGRMVSIEDGAKMVKDRVGNLYHLEQLCGR